MRIQLSAASWVDHISGWVAPPRSETLIAQLLRELPFEQHSVVLFGKAVPQPRLISWCGTMPYTYSGLTLPARVIPQCLVGILDGVSTLTSTAFNHLLLNYYRDGVDGMGYHSDNEPELGPDPLVASLSLGATRRFTLKSRKETQTFALDLANGDLVVMGGACQAEFRHALNKTQRPIGVRLSVTFRRIVDRTGRDATAALRT